MRHWRITATADRAAPEPFYPLSRVAPRTVNFGPATPPSRGGLSGAHAGEPESGDLFTA